MSLNVVLLGALIRCSLPLTLIIALLLNIAPINNPRVITCNPLCQDILRIQHISSIHCILNGFRLPSCPKKRASLTIMCLATLRTLNLKPQVQPFEAEQEPCPFSRELQANDTGLFAPRMCTS